MPVYSSILGIYHILLYHSSDVLRPLLRHSVCSMYVCSISQILIRCGCTHSLYAFSSVEWLWLSAETTSAQCLYMRVICQCRHLRRQRHEWQEVTFSLPLLAAFSYVFLSVGFIFFATFGCLVTLIFHKLYRHAYKHIVYIHIVYHNFMRTRYVSTIICLRIAFEGWRGNSLRVCRHH